MILSDKAFNVIRFLCELLVPAIGALYFGIAKIWNLPFGQEIVGTCACISTFLGAFIGVSRNEYNKQQDDEVQG